MTREDVIRQIVERDVQGQTLVDAMVRREAAPLHAAACEHFGTWETAVKYAGVHGSRLRDDRDYTPDRVLRQIRRLCQSGYSLRAGRNQHRYPDLYEAARRHFGGWKRALRAAGLDLKNAGLRSTPRRLDRQAIIAAMQKRHREGLSLRWSRVCMEDQALAKAAKSAFAGWRRALAAANLPQRSGHVATNRRWTTDVVIQAIQARQRAGKPLSYTAVRRDDNCLLDAARRYLGGWSSALAAAGVVTPPNTSDPAGTSDTHAQGDNA
jgi:hypothetical protein